MSDDGIETNRPVGETQANAATLCTSLLEAQLKVSALPPAACENIRAQFGGRTFEPLELDRAVENARKLVADLTGGTQIQGPGRVTEHV